MPVPSSDSPSRYSTVTRGFAVGFVMAAVILSGGRAMGQEETSSTTAPPASSTTAPPTTATPTTAPPTTATPTTAPASTDTSTGDGGATSTTLTAEQQAERDRAVANLNLAKSADVEIAAQLKDINSAANETLEKIEAARKRIEVARQIADRSKEDLRSSDSKQAQIEASLRVKAVEGFKTRAVGPGALFDEASVNEALRQNQLLDQASLSTTDLLEELRGLLEDRRIATVEADQATRDAETAEAELQAELEVLKDQQAVQIGLKQEAERRIDQWAGELTAYAREDAAVQRLIGQSAAPVDTAINAPTTPSALGFQWPMQARVTSEYGYRIHPVYGSRRLHAGMDLGAPRGTPIASAADGVVIFSGVQGGYGSTVIVDHGGGVTTLYAHMSQRNVSQGQLTSRGDIVGLVGATGTATGNHLHFEVRVNGGAVNPRSYLP